AAVVRIILDDPALAADWRAELVEMGARIRALRAKLGAADPRLAYIAGQKGMFSMLPVTPQQVLSIREKHGIYMAGSGRFNVVGLSDSSVDHFAQAVIEELDA